MARRQKVREHVLVVWKPIATDKVRQEFHEAVYKVGGSVLVASDDTASVGATLLGNVMYGPTQRVVRLIGTAYRATQQGKLEALLKKSPELARVIGLLRHLQKSKESGPTDGEAHTTQMPPNGCFVSGA